MEPETENEHHRKGRPECFPGVEVKRLAVSIPVTTHELLREFARKHFHNKVPVLVDAAIRSSVDSHGASAPFQIHGLQCRVADLEQQNQFLRKQLGDAGKQLRFAQVRKNHLSRKVVVLKKRLSMFENPNLCLDADLDLRQDIQDHPYLEEGYSLRYRSGVEDWILAILSRYPDSSEKDIIRDLQGKQVPGMAVRVAPRMVSVCLRSLIRKEMIFRFGEGTRKSPYQYAVHPGKMHVAKTLASIFEEDGLL